MTLRTCVPAVLLTSLFVCNPVVPLFASHAPSVKRSKSDRDINAIGHRDIMHPQDRKYIGSPLIEQQRGAAWAAVVERSAKLMDDPNLTGYVAELARDLARNSDAQMPITVTLIDSDEVGACTSPGGHQYVTRGLLVQLESEGELAAVLAHGIAHTALHSPTIQGIRHVMMQVALPNPAQDSPFAWFTCTSPPSRIMDGISPVYELDADYFGAQYLYKAGYDPDCYIGFIQRLWPASSLSKNGTVAISYFPVPSKRLKALGDEFADILPPRDKAIVSTSKFEEFKERLYIWRTQHPQPSQPVLRRADADNQR